MYDRYLIKFLGIITLLVTLILNFSPEASSKQKYKSGEKLRIKTSKTYLRNKPKPFGAKVLKILDHGTTVLYLSTKGPWLKVNYKGEKGFISQN